AAGGNVYSFTRGTLNAGQNGAATLSGRLASTLPPGLRAITNTAAIATTTSGDMLENNEAADVNDISTRPELNLDPVYDAGTPYPGKAITYTLHYTNVSAMDTIGVVITVTRPSWRASSPLGWTPNSDTDTYWIGNLAAGQSGSVTYALTLPVTYTLDMNAFVLTFFVQDGGPGGLTIAQDQSTTVIGVPDLIIDRVTLPQATLPNRPFTATVVIRNAGLGRACNPSNCGGFYLDAFINPLVAPPSYPYQGDGNFYFPITTSIAAGQVMTFNFKALVYTTTRAALYFKVDNFNCSPPDHTDPCLPSHSLGGLVPEYNEQNNVSGPIRPAGFALYLPLIMKNAH
ncbi:MAG TPA: hypothetical protein VLG46_12610, partial [Anaerolineae bacterium]|nr:hypothetical protein [Anaerolineae bacterium]